MYIHDIDPSFIYTHIHTYEYIYTHIYYSFRNIHLQFFNEMFILGKKTYWLLNWLRNNYSVKGLIFGGVLVNEFLVKTKQQRRVCPHNRQHHSMRWYSTHTHTCQPNTEIHHSLHLCSSRHERLSSHSCCYSQELQF